MFTKADLSNIDVKFPLIIYYCCINSFL